MKILLEIVENRRPMVGAETSTTYGIGCADCTPMGMTMRADYTPTGMTMRTKWE